MLGTAGSGRKARGTAAPERSDERARRTGWARHLTRVAWRPVAILLVSRVTALIVLELAHPLTHSSSPFHVRGWDSAWFIAAAQHGWPHVVAAHTPTTLAFLPALPTLIRVVHAVLPLTWNGAAYVADFITQIAMVIGFWLLTSDLWGKKTANKATLLLCFFPGAYVFSLIYAEPLIIASASVCFLALRRRHWALAGLAATLGTLTSPNGFALIACCAWEAFFAIHERRDWRSLSAAVLAPAGIVAWFAYLWVTTGSALAWSTTIRKGWDQSPSLLSFPHLVERAAQYGLKDINSVVAVAGTLVAGVLLVVLLRSGAPSVLIVFTVIVLGISFFSRPIGLHPRFVMVAFPLIMALAYCLKGELYSATLAVSAMLMAVLLVITVSTIALTP
jgi:hypothetical protein